MSKATEKNTPKPISASQAEYITTFMNRISEKVKSFHYQPYGEGSWYPVFEDIDPDPAVQVWANITIQAMFNMMESTPTRKGEQAAWSAFRITDVMENVYDYLP